MAAAAPIAPRTGPPRANPTTPPRRPAVNSTVSSLMATMAEDLGAGGGFAGGAGGPPCRTCEAVPRDGWTRGATGRRPRRSLRRGRRRGAFRISPCFFWLWALGGARWKGADGQLNDQCTESAGGVDGSGQQHGRRRWLGQRRTTVWSMAKGDNVGQDHGMRHAE